MQITKFTHACIRIEHDGRVLVVDPGIWSEAGALLGVDAVLLTHEHADHVDVMRLAGLGVPVYAPADAKLEPATIADRIAVTPVTAGQKFTVAGFEVTAVGGRHATIYGGKPDCANLGYVIDDRVYHPGDSLHVPQQPVEVLCVPMQAAWVKMVEVIDFVRAVDPHMAFGIHDAQINEYGLESVNGWLGQETDNGYRYLAPREALELPELS